MATIIRGFYPSSIAPLDDFVTILFLLGMIFSPTFRSLKLLLKQLDALVYGMQLSSEKSRERNLWTSKYQLENFGAFCRFVSETFNDALLKSWARIPRT